MENVASIISNKFILVAVDTNFVFTAGDTTVNLDSAKKVYKLNDTLAIAITGLFQKTTDVQKYILKLSELGGNKTFDETAQDIQNFFGSSGDFNVEELKEMVGDISKFIDENDVINTEAFLQHLSGKPHLQAIVSESFEMQKSGLTNGTSILLFGMDEDTQQIRVGKYIIVGNSLRGNEPELAPNFIYMIISSVTKPHGEIQLLERKLIEELQPFITEGWENSKHKTALLIEEAKKVLVKAFSQLNIFKMQPNIVFYELSPQTNNHFTEPDVELATMSFLRSE